jgi:hypothetical protein
VTFTDFTVIPSSANQEVTVRALTERVNALSADIVALQRAMIYQSSHLARLERYISIDPYGNVQITSDGLLLLRATTRIASESGAFSVSAAGSTVEMNTLGVSVEGGGTFGVSMPKTQISAGSIKLNCPVTTAAGVLRASTVMASDAMVSPTYTPGSGNIW